jgi:hypothetical protein
MSRLSIPLGLALAAVSLLAAATPARAEELPFQAGGSGFLHFPERGNPVLGGEGRVTHLGKSVLSISLHDYEGYGDLDLQRLLLFAANGDMLRAKVEAEFDPGLGIIVIVGKITFTGGSGRFADATGSADLLILIDGALDGAEFYFAVEGTIDY